MRFPFFVLVECLFMPALPALSQTVSDSTTILHERVDSLFRQWNTPNSPGCALGIIRNGEFDYRRGYGMADLERHIPNSPTTVFNIGSVSKQFTSTCLLLLQQQGKLNLDDEARRYIPELPDYGKPVTIRQLLIHTSGIRDYVQMMFLAGTSYDRVVTTNDALRVITRQKALNFRPGDEWLYSNSGYVLASLIVERISKKPIRLFAHESIFEPLGMQATLVVDDHSTHVHGQAVGYGPRPGGGFKSITSNWEDTGDGGVYSTVEDLLLWDRNFYEPKVGDKAMVGQLLTVGRLNDGTPLQYALGLGVGTYRGLRTVSHEGEWAGFRAELMRFPDQKFSVIILSNCSAIVPLRLARQISDIYLAEQMMKPQQATIGRSPVTPTVQLNPNELSRYAGFFRNPLDELVRQLVVTNGKLLYVRGPNNFTELAALGNDRFRMVDVPVETDVIFESSPAGGVSEMRVISDNTKPIRFDSFIPVVPTAQQIDQYLGTFHSEELDVDYQILPHGSSLYLKTTNPPDDQLFPTVPDVFKIGDVGYLRFVRDERHAVSGFSFTFGKVRSIVFTRKQ